MIISTTKKEKETTKKLLNYKFMIMRKLYYILFLYLAIGMFWVLFAVKYSFHRYISLPFWILFAWFTDKIVVKYIIRQILINTFVEVSIQVIKEKRSKTKKTVIKKKSKK